MARPTLLNEVTNEDDGTTYTDPLAEGQPADVGEVPNVEPDVPEKFQGKSQAELAAMLVEAERFQGKQSSEVGQLRRDFDELLKSNLEKQQPAIHIPEEEEINFFERPEEAIDQRINAHPDVKKAKAANEAAIKSATKNDLLRAHPDMQDIVGAPEFAAWVEKSPIRKKLLKAAHFDYDFDSANELFNTWKERADVVARTVAVDKKERSATIKAASTGAGGNAAPKVSKKMYRRSDIVRLMNTDPERYASMAEEIFAAYAEGRVK